MTLTCGNCDKKLNIPDSKVPTGKTFSIKCPSCGNKISHKPEQKTEPDVKEGEGVEKAEEKLKEIRKPAINLDFDIAANVPESMDTYQEDLSPGEHAALVCDKENATVVEKALKESGYRVSIVENSTVAVNKIKFNRYSVIIINENFDHFTVKDNPVLLYVQPMPITERRNIIVALIGDGFKTSDQMTAFTLSVNIVINSKDVDNLDNLLKRTIQDNEQFYKIFREALKAAGKV